MDKKKKFAIEIATAVPFKFNASRPLEILVDSLLPRQLLLLCINLEEEEEKKKACF